MVRYEFRARPANLRMITIDGDSMEPMLSSGDRILIDTSQRVSASPRAPRRNASATDWARPPVMNRRSR